MEDKEKEIDYNNKQIIELKDTIKKYYDTNVDDINTYEYSEEDNLDEVLKKQTDAIARLNIIIDTSDQSVKNEIRNKIKKLKKVEPDKVFSKFYHEGIIEISNILVSVDRFYIKEVEKDGEIKINFVCTDSKVPKGVFNTFDDRDYELKNLYKLKNSKIFYEMYLDNRLFRDGKMIINTPDSLKLFNEYIDKWTRDEHKMVAETMVNS